MIHKVLCFFCHCADINAFKPADKIQHSPTAALVAGSDVDVPTTLSSLLSANVQPEHGSIIAGPLSSTMLDVTDQNVEDVNTVDSVVTKLFAPIQPYGLQSYDHIF